MIIYSHKRKAPFIKKGFTTTFFSEKKQGRKVAESNRRKANSRDFRRNGKAVYRLKQIPTCKSIPHKGTKVKRLGMWNGNQIGEIVNLQNAEVTKMLDNKSEQK